jgi:hypothetical protein
MLRYSSSLATIAAIMIASASAAAGKDCTCRYFSQRIEIGGVACINGKLAQCLMFLNNPSWKFIGDTCPQSRNFTTPPVQSAPPKLAAR